VIDSDRPGNVLQLLLAAVEELGIDFALYVSKRVVGNANLAWRGDSLETGRDVHAISEDVATLNNHVAEIDADAKLDTVVLGESDIAFGHLPLHRDCRSDGSDHFGNTIRMPSPVVLTMRPLWLAIFGSISSRRSARSRNSVATHQPAVTRDVRCQYRCVPTLDPLLAQYALHKTTSMK